ncbi:MAG: ABC transporter substrate-binding protein [Chitinophagaceae bacterium]|nr:ABC transporter substrate-binding protein [Chitinophagaceae bacterium]
MQRTVIDQMGREVTFNYYPERIISVVPSQTELLYDLGLEREVVGITKFCVHPDEWFRNKERVGGTKKLDIEKIRSLQPDLIIANKEENTQEQIELLEKEFPVWVSDITNLPGAVNMIQALGQVTGMEGKANKLVEEIVQGFNDLHKANTPKRVAYMIWRSPWMSVGNDTFIHSMIRTIGWQNILAGKTRYPEVTLEELKKYQPELILLSSEPFPFKEQHITEVKEVLPYTEVMLVDGEMFSWYGSRLKNAVAYLQELVR